ncbi:hypothetical protein [Natronocalculus amylovorans]|uniref:Uncharacterized protein n=1 Tax=Natronocalculus amylovorans TaxID=2917812 RepID=A0AAE3FX21_9EURY|nr:hypothetical protein [Natronocalculus amylovorans]MCL9816588.1 hypothetical protein [Natronocalculus amylovorans]
MSTQISVIQAKLNTYEAGIETKLSFKMSTPLITDFGIFAAQTTQLGEEVDA